MANSTQLEDNDRTKEKKKVAKKQRAERKQAQQELQARVNDHVASGGGNIRSKLYL